MPLNVAVVGCGALANATHLPNIAASAEFTLAVACDQDEAAATAAARRFGAARVSTDWREVAAAADVDLIVLCTHTNLRAELICRALEHGKPVYCEKPLAIEETEMLRIIRASQRTGIPICVGHNRRSAPAMQQLLELVGRARSTGGDLPPIIDRNSGLREPLREESAAQILIRVNDDSRTWKGWIFDDPQGIMFSEMVHFIDAALLLAASDPVAVYGHGSIRGNFTQIISFRDGSTATMLQSMVGNFDYPKELYEVSVGHVTVALDHFVEVRQRGFTDVPFRTTFPLEAGAGLSSRQGIEAFHEGVERLQEFKRQGQEPPCRLIWPDKGHRQHLEAFARHLRGQGPNPCPVESAYAVTRIAMKLLQSTREGRALPVQPEDYDPVRGDFTALHTQAL